MILDCKKLNGEAKKLSDYLKSKIISQDESIDEVCSGIQKYFVGLSDTNKPLFNFLFAGPTGSGKTKIVQEIAKYFDLEPVVIDCGEIQQQHELSKLLGAPPGYIGHGETKPLLSKERIEIQGKPNVILFDEVEKATGGLYNVLLGILDNGYVTTNSNVKVSFLNCLVFMTCNIGAKEIESEENKIGFSKKSLTWEEKQAYTTKEIKKKFLPEFINRLDKMIVFKQLTREDVEHIFELELNQIQERLNNCEYKKIFLFVSPEAKRKIVDAGYSIQYGARNLKRVMEKEIIQPISNALSLDEVEEGDSIQLEVNPAGEFFFEKKIYSRTKSKACWISVLEIV